MTDKKQAQTTNLNLTAKEKFNALANAKHVFAYKEDGISFKLIEVFQNDDGCKAVVVDENGEIGGLFTDSKSATSALNDVMSVFGSDQPFITMHIKETRKGQSVYYVEVK